MKGKLGKMKLDLSLLTVLLVIVVLVLTIVLVYKQSEGFYGEGGPQPGAPPGGPQPGAPPGGPQPEVPPGGAPPEVPEVPQGGRQGPLTQDEKFEELTRNLRMVNMTPGEKEEYKITIKNMTPDQVETEKELLEDDKTNKESANLPNENEINVIVDKLLIIEALIESKNTNQQFVLPEGEERRVLNLNFSRCNKQKLLSEATLGDLVNCMMEPAMVEQNMNTSGMENPAF